MNDIIKALQFEKEQLEARIRLLEDKIESDNRQISEYDHELRQAKRMLKAAVPIINNMFPEVGSCWGCANHDEAKDECKGGAFAECAEVCKWEHADEALALIGGEADD
jgi:chromosome segregation ATPase